MIKKEFRIFFTALMFFTRIPCPSQKDFKPEDMHETTRYLGIIGIITGAVGFLVFCGAREILPLSTAVILSISATVILTGAFHEDGFADAVDGFGAGWKKKQILRIMKDSHLGTYGVAGLILLFLLKYSLLVNLVNHENTLFTAAVFISMHSVSRAAASILIYVLEYVQDEEKSKVQNLTKGMTTASLMFLLLTGCLPVLLFLPEWKIMTITAIPFLLVITAGFYFKKKIGGYTGDCLGAVQQIGEVSFLTALAVIVNFI